MEGDIDKAVIEPTGRLAEIFSQHQLWGIIAFLCVLLVFQFIVFMWKLRSKDKAREKQVKDLFDQQTNQVREIIDQQKEQSDQYGTLLEGRHDQFIDILERSIGAMSAMSSAEERVRCQVAQLEQEARNIADRTSSLVLTVRTLLQQQPGGADNDPE